MKKILTLLALASVSTMYAGPYEDYPQTSSPRRYRSYQADDYRGSTGAQQIRNSNYGTQKATPTPTQSPAQSPAQSPISNLNQSASSDQEITKNINSSLNSGKYGGGFKDVKFKVNNGNVRLSGTVDTLEYKSKVESLVKRVNGVQQVDNQITVSE